MTKFLVAFLLVGCGEAFTAASVEAPVDAVDGGGPDPVEVDAAGSGGAPSATGGSSPEGSVGSGGASSGGTLGAGGAAAGGTGSGGKPAPGLPPCCTDVDCPTALPYCTPWGTCGPGGDPYSCNYDFHCESYCYHCVGTQGGTCTAEKSCDCV